MNGRRIWLLALGAGLLLAAAGAGVQAMHPSRPPEPGPRITLLSVRGLSWERVVALRHERRLPGLEALLGSGGSWGDILAEDFPSDKAILASQVTGYWPWRHGLGDGREEGPGAARFRRPVWRALSAAGQPSAAVGFPSWLGGAGDEGPPSARPAPAGLEEALAAVAGGESLPEPLGLLLRECAASDLGIAEEALRRAADPSLRHLFVRLEGLGLWQERLLGGADALPGPRRMRLLAGYYELCDRLLADLAAARRSSTILLVSERGNMSGRPPFRRYFPEMEEYPPLGFLYAAGPSIRRGTLPLLVYPVDLAPTIYYLAGRPLPGNLDGRVLFALLEETYYFKHPLEYR